jgi:hypothetical protein
MILLTSVADRVSDPHWFNADPDALVRDSVADPWHFGVDPDPQHWSEIYIRRCHGSTFCNTHANTFILLIMLNRCWTVVELSSCCGSGFWFLLVSCKVMRIRIQLINLLRIRMRVFCKMTAKSTKNTDHHSTRQICLICHLPNHSYILFVQKPD